mmetsp:Transcript_60684/g.130312  ORF Transcript_60684/g.130312 Transcript_60684/m.130312 type:complete len:212 (-) Transcript_60684:271-906(-)
MEALYAEMIIKEQRWNARDLAKNAIAREQRGQPLTRQGVDTSQRQERKRPPYGGLARAATAPCYHGDMALKPTQCIPVLNGTISPKPEQGTRGLVERQVQAKASHLPFMLWPNDMSHSSLSSVKLKEELRPSSSAVETLPMAVAASEESSAAAVGSRSGSTTSSTTGPKTSLLKRPAMVANQNAVGGMKVMWPNDIRWSHHLTGDRTAKVR